MAPGASAEAVKPLGRFLPEWGADGVVPGSEGSSSANALQGAGGSSPKRPRWGDTEAATAGRLIFKLKKGMTFL